MADEFRVQSMGNLIRGTKVSCQRIGDKVYLVIGTDPPTFVELTERAGRAFGRKLAKVLAAEKPALTIYREE